MAHPNLGMLLVEGGKVAQAPTCPGTLGGEGAGEVPLGGAQGADGTIEAAVGEALPEECGDDVTEPGLEGWRGECSAKGSGSGSGYGGNEPAPTLVEGKGKTSQDGYGPGIAGVAEK